MNAAREPLVLVDSRGTVLATNRVFLETFGISASEAEGRPFSTLSGGLFSDQIPRDAIAGLLAGGLDTPVRTDEFHWPGDARARRLRLRLDGVSDAAAGERRILVSIEPVDTGSPPAPLGGHKDLYRTWFEVTLESIGDAVIATDPRALVTFMNPTAERLTGWSLAEARGKPLREVFNIINEDTRETVLSPVDKAIREGSIVGLANHTLLIARDGSERPIDDSAAPIRDAAGEIAGVVMVFHDITERRMTERLIEASEVRFRRLFESARDGILIIDPLTRKITEANPFMEELLHTPRQDLIGKELWEIGLLRDQQDARVAYERLIETGYIRYDDLPLMTAGGALRDVEFVSNVYRENSHPVIQCNIRDITERNRLTAQREEALRTAREALAAAERADRAKDVFLATLSHELRTPLNAILGWAVLLRTSGKCDTGDVAEGVSVIERNARAQGKLIEDVLDVARIVSGKFTLDLRPCDLATLVRGASEAFLPAAAARSITLDVLSDEPGAGRLWVRGDAHRLQQVIANLLSNALKFTPSGGRVALRLTRAGDDARFTVTDTGRGIAGEFLPFVFDRFRQADEGSTRLLGGLGLGLSIVREIVELHGGSARAFSEGEQRGATFTIDLPLIAPPESAQSAAAPALEAAWTSPPLTGVRVLVVDDEPDARALAAKSIRDAGAGVETADSADAAFAAAASAQPPFDLLLCDIGMAGEDGFSLLRRLRAAGLNVKALPAVALTAFASPQDKRRALLAGFQLHLAKPVDPVELIAVVASLTGRNGHN